eukprot:TRINITY_DN66880_c0_g1_i1.p1 TRINITY_DN66880_c0_g1~~TRINITY_DN66880_c0_g1_i1.p1  ORF type:complete len:107 (+),score=4.26 TRINITY_DN66880_c0_g1_i1:2-322(+)
MYECSLLLLLGFLCSFPSLSFLFCLFLCLSLTFLGCSVSYVLLFPCAQGLGWVWDMSTPTSTQTRKRAVFVPPLAYFPLHRRKAGSFICFVYFVSNFLGSCGLGVA